MSFAPASKENAISKAYHSLTLIAGLEADKNRIARGVDLNVLGGGIFHKNLCVLGNIDVGSFVNGNLNGDLFTSNIMASNLTEGITIIGDLTIDNDFVFNANTINTNTITSLEGDELTLESSDMIILNTPTVVITGNVEADTAILDTACANTVQTDLIESKTGGDITIGGNLVPATSNVFSIGGPTQQWDTLYVSDIIATGAIVGNIMNMMLAGNIVMADVFCADMEVQTDKIVPKSGSGGTVLIDGDINMMSGNITNINNITGSPGNGGNIDLCGNVNIKAGFDLIVNEGDLIVNEGDVVVNEGDINLNGGDITNVTNITGNGVGGTIDLCGNVNIKANGTLTIQEGDLIVNEGDINLMGGEITNITNITGNGVGGTIDLCGNVNIKANGTLTIQEGDLIVNEGDINVNGGNITNVTNITTTTGNIEISGNIDMMCGEITNLQVLKVDQLFGKNSPINVEDELNVTSTGAKITFEDGIIIGDTASATSNARSVIIGKGATDNGSHNVVAIGYGAANSSSSHRNAILIGSNATCNGRENIVIGTSAYSLASSGVSIGFETVSKSLNIVAIGKKATIGTASAQSICIGHYARINNATSGSICIGSGGFANAANVSSRFSIAIGFQALVDTGASNSIAIGAASKTANTGGIAVGHFASVTSAGGIAMGHYANAAVGVYTVAIGGGTSDANAAKAVGTNSVAIGRNSCTSSVANNAIAIGYSAECTVSENGISIGKNATVSVQDGIALGNGAAVSVSTRALALNVNSDSVIVPGGGTPYLQCVVNGVNREIPLEVGGGGGGGNVTSISDLIVNGNLDMVCANISNVDSIYVENVYGKSPINFHDTINIVDTGSGGNITFASGIIIGNTLTSTSFTDAISIGKAASAGGVESTAIGDSSSANAVSATAIGARAVAGALQSIAIGSGTSPAKATVTNAIAIGTGAHGYNTNVVALGPTASASASGSIAIGAFATMTAIGTDGIAIGNGATVNNLRGIAIGQGAMVMNGGNYGIAIGHNVTSLGTGQLWMRHRASGGTGAGVRWHVNGPVSELYSIVSSLKYKTAITDLEDVGTKIDQVRPIRYMPREEDCNGRTKEPQIGFIAEEIAKIFPEVVSYDEFGISVGSVDYERFVVILLKEIKAMRLRLNALENP